MFSKLLAIFKTWNNRRTFKSKGWTFCKTEEEFFEKFIGTTIQSKGAILNSNTIEEIKTVADLEKAKHNRLNG